MKQPVFKLSSLLLAVLVFSAFKVQAAPVDQNLDKDGVAIHGYDPVAYFSNSQPTPGDAKYTAIHNDATYRFSSSANRDTFRASPDKYLPQFGGFCAYGVAVRKKLDGDPQAWRIVEGKLYLNLNPDVQKKWLDDIPGNLGKANENWPKIKNTSASQL